MSEVRFEVFGTEFCRILRAVARFQALPKDFGGEYAAVRCLASGDRLVLAALNGVSAAVGSVEVDDVEGVGTFSVPHAQVKAVLAIFDRRLPSGCTREDYILQVVVSDRSISIEDVSTLFDGDRFEIAVPMEEDAARGDASESDKVMSALAVLQGGLGPTQRDEDLTGGIFFSPKEAARLARAASDLGIEMHLRMVGRLLVAPLGEDFVAYTAGSLRHDDEKRPYVDERAMRWWRSRLFEVVHEGVL